LAKGQDKALVIAIVVEDRFTAVTMIHQKVNHSRILQPQLAGRGSVKKNNTT
jgi:hypothetical protein